MVIGIWIILGLFFVPAIVASARGHHNSGSVFVLNFFLGWTLVGWVVALAIACRHFLGKGSIIGNC
jgi:hypothetical protein